MPPPLLVVLIIRNAGLRSSLSARLELAGVEVVSAAEFRDPALERRLRARAVLVLDEEVVADEAGDWLAALRTEAQWSRIVVLVEAGDGPAGPDDRLVRIERRTAAAELARLLPQWRERDA